MPSSLPKDQGGEEASLPKYVYQVQSERSSEHLRNVSTTVAVGSALKSPSSQRNLEGQNHNALPCEDRSHDPIVEGLDVNETRFGDQGDNSSEVAEPTARNGFSPCTSVGETISFSKSLSGSHTASSDGNAYNTIKRNDWLVEDGPSQQELSRESCAESSVAKAPKSDGGSPTGRVDGGVTGGDRSGSQVAAGCSKEQLGVQSSQSESDASSFVRLIEEAMGRDTRESREDTEVAPASISTQSIALHRLAPSNQTWSAKSLECLECSSQEEESALKIPANDGLGVGDDECTVVNLTTVGVDLRMPYSHASSESTSVEGSEDDGGPWITYISPEGYPYVYNPVTGDSKWVADSEKESIQVHDAVEVNTTSTPAEHDGSTSEKIDGSNGCGCPAAINVGSRQVVGQEKGEVIPEIQSNGTWEASQSSRETIVPDARNSVGETPLHLAATRLSSQGLSLLLANGADIDVADGRGRTPLHIACKSPRVSKSCSGGGDGRAREFIELLLSSGAAEDARDADGRTPLHLAVLAGNVDAVWVLVTAGASEIADSAGNLPLHLAAAKGHAEIMQILMHSSEGRDNTPASLSYASQRDHSQSRVTTETSSEGGETDGVSVEVGNPSVSYNTVADHRIPLEHAENRDGVENSFTRWKTTPLSRSETINGARKSSWRYPAKSFLRKRAQAERLSGLGALQSTSDSDEDYEHGGSRFSWNTEQENICKHPPDEVSGRRGQSSGRRRQGRNWDDQAPTWPWPSSTQNYFEGEFEIGVHRNSKVEAYTSPHAQNVSKIMHTTDLASDDGGSPVPLQVCSTFPVSSTMVSRTDDTHLPLPWNESRRGPAAGARDEKDRTPLHYACYMGNARKTRHLCQMGADLEARDYKGHSPLIVAAATGSTACLQVLLEVGADLHGRNKIDDTPLHVAAWYSNLACAKTLVSFGARLDARNCFGLTPKEALLFAGRKIWKGLVPRRLLDTLEFLENVEASTTAPSNSRAWKALEGSRIEATTIPTGGHDDGYITHCTRNQEIMKQERVESKLRGFEFGRHYFNTRRLLGGSREAAGIDSSGYTPPGALRGCGYAVTEERMERDHKAQRVFHGQEDGVGRRRGSHNSTSSSGHRERRYIALDDAATGSLAPKGINTKSGRIDRRHRQALVDQSPTRQRCRAALDFPSHEKNSQNRHPTPRESRRTRSGGGYPRLEELNRKFKARRPTGRAEEVPSSGTTSSFRAAGGKLIDVGRGLNSQLDGTIHRWLNLFTGSIVGDGRIRHVPGPAAGNVQNLPTSPNHLAGRTFTDDELNNTVAKPCARTQKVDDGHIRLESMVETSTLGMKMPLALIPMQPPQDVLVAMKKRAASGKQREGSLDPPPEVTAALREATKDMESSVWRDNVGGDSSQIT